VDDKVVKAITKYCVKLLSTRKYPAITILGGEPTLLRGINDIIKELLQVPDISIIFYSNFTAPILVYQQLQELGVELELSYHRHECLKRGHNFIEKLKYLDPNLTDIHIMYEDEHAIEDTLKIRETIPKSEIAFIRPCYKWTKVYTKKEIDLAMEVINVAHPEVKSLILEYEDDTIEQATFSSIIGRGMNKFPHWLCQARAMNLFIDPFGNVYDCQEYWGDNKSPRFNILHNPFYTFISPIICQASQCSCEIFLPKKRVFHG
jgi:sulfatase maturation enzyme AslB (radical SAM superfamily)